MAQQSLAEEARKAEAVHELNDDERHWKILEDNSRLESERTAALLKLTQFGKRAMSFLERRRLRKVYQNTESEGLRNRILQYRALIQQKAEMTGKRAAPEPGQGISETSWLFQRVIAERKPERKKLAVPTMGGVEEEISWREDAANDASELVNRLSRLRD